MIDDSSLNYENKYTQLKMMNLERDLIKGSKSGGKDIPTGFIRKNDRAPGEIFSEKKSKRV